jgi:anti-anti-sigma factor
MSIRMPGSPDLGVGVFNPPDFSIETIESGAGREIRARGELDSATCKSLLEHFERVARRAAGDELVVDLEQISFIDSAGIRSIVLIQRSASELGVSLVVRPPPPPVMELLELAGIAERLTLSPREEHARPAGSHVVQCDATLPCEPDAPSRARAKVRRRAAAYLEKPGLDAVILMTSELVTNAVIHPEHPAGAVISLQVTAYRDRVRVEVTDSGDGFDPTVKRPPRETGGRGLFLVDALASRWGTRRSDPGERFTVWFELDFAADQASAMAARAS